MSVKIYYLKNSCHAFDLDGTLAIDDEPKNHNYIGPAIPSMIERVHKMLDDGENVEIFTARVYPGKHSTPEFTIRQWLYFNGLPPSLNITCLKHRKIAYIWDDRAIQVIPNTGKILQEEYTRAQTILKVFKLTHPLEWKSSDDDLLESING
jgi:hypothetical protein